MDEAIKDQGAIIIIFGATGDLARKKLFPALLSLKKRKLLKGNLNIIGFSRRDMDDRGFRDFLMEEANGFKEETESSAFLKTTYFVSGEFSDLNAYYKLGAKIKEIDKGHKICSPKFFHLSITPFSYETVLDGLQKSNLVEECRFGAKASVLIEKPLGSDLESAIKANLLLAKMFGESEIFRVDHYLHKKEVQNLINFRINNKNLKEFWNSQYIKKVEIDQFEKKDVTDRGSFYDKIGALRDVGQNHLLLIAAIVGMEISDRQDIPALHQYRADLLEKLNCGAKDITRGQYENYKNTKGVSGDSDTETFFRLRTHVDDPRWRDTEFIIDSGKALNQDCVRIVVSFKKVIQFCSSDGAYCHDADTIIFNIQPNANLELCLKSQKDNQSPQKCEISSLKNFGYESSSIVENYEKVYLDALLGNQRNFVSKQEVEASWKFIDPIISNWHSIPLKIYKKGSDPGTI